MSIAFSCPCGKPLKARDEFAGQKVRCPGCRRILTIPAASRSEAPTPGAAEIGPESESGGPATFFSESAFSAPVLSGPVLSEDPLAATLAEPEKSSVPEIEVEILDAPDRVERFGNSDNAVSTENLWVDKSLEQTVTPWLDEDRRRFDRTTKPLVSWTWLVLIALTSIIALGAVIAVGAALVFE